MIRRIALVVFATSIIVSGASVWAAPAQAPGPIETQAEQQIARVRDTIVDALWLKTDEYWHGGDPAPAIDICRMVIELDPHFVEAYSVGAWLSLSLPKANEHDALDFYQQGIARNPQSYELLHEFGFEYYVLRKHNPEAALPYLKRAAELSPTAPIKHTYAHALAQAGKPREAAAEWLRILKQFPNDPIARKELAKLQASGKIGKGR
jgi:tetratricopeptide (TPR) repeat protein